MGQEINIDIKKRIDKIQKVSQENTEVKKLEIKYLFDRDISFKWTSLFVVAFFGGIFILYLKRRLQKIQDLQIAVIKKQIFLENEVNSFGEADV